MKGLRLPKIRLPSKSERGNTDNLPPSVKDTGRQSSRATPSLWRNPGVLLGLIVAAFVAVIVVGLYSLAVSNRLDNLARSTAALEARDVGDEISALLSGVEQRLVELEQRQQKMAATLNDAVMQSDLLAVIGSFNSELESIKERAVPAVAKSPQLSNRASTQAWTIHLATLSDMAAADKLISSAKAQGINVSMQPISVNDKEAYRLSIVGLPSREQAEKLSTEVQQRLKLTRKPWIAIEQ